MEQIRKDLDNATNLLSGVSTGIYNLGHSESDLAYKLYSDAEDLCELLREDK